MRVPARAHALARGPVRSWLRRTQARSVLGWGARQPGPPDFVGIGAQRCGTSWWHSLIEQHPRVASLGMGAKELHHFDDLWRSSVAPDASAYAAHFRRRPGQIAGEWTPRYLLDPWAVPMIREVAPDARLLVMLRDPVARFRSGLRHELKVRGSLAADAVTAAYQRGLYGPQLRHVVAHVPREQVLVLQFERCVADPAGQLDRTFAFLGLEPHRPTSPGERNESAPSVEVPAPLLEHVRAGYRADAVGLAALLGGDLDLDLWPGVR